MESNADYQRDLSRTLAKNSMGGGRRLGSVLQSGLAARHAGRQFGRQLQFEGQALNRKASDVSANHSQRLLNMKAKNMRNEEKMMGLQTWLGLGGMGINFMEGRRRKGLMEQDRLAQAADRKYYKKRDAENSAFNRALLSRMGGGMAPISGGSYYKGGM